MKKATTFLFFLLLCNNAFSQVWKNLTSVNASVNRAGAFAINGNGYIFGGGYQSSMYDYDTAAHTWTQVTNYPANTTDGIVGCSVNGLGYAGTGTASFSFSTSFYKYDPTTGVGGTWSQLPDFPGVARAYAVSFALDGKVYIGGGLTNYVGTTGVINYQNGYSVTPYNDFWVYDPVANKWDSIPHCPALGVSCDAVAFVIGDKAYVGTGGSITTFDNGQSIPQKDFWEYDTTSKVWTQIADITGTRAEAAAFATCTKGYVGTGYTDVSRSTDDDDFWQYDPNKNSWTQIANFGGAARNGACSFAIGKTGYVCVGSPPSGSDFQDLWSFAAIVTPAFSADTSVCQGGQIAFSDTSNFSPTNWLWTFNGGKPHTSSSKDTTVEYDTVGVFDVTLNAWNGCDSATETFSDYVHVGAGGALDIEPQSPVLCDGSVVKLYVSGSTGNFTWSPSSSLSSSTGDTVLASPTADVTYTVTGAASGGCFATGSDAVSVVAAPNKPTIGKSANGDTLISSATQGNQWYYNDTLINGATNQTLIITGQKIGSYTVEVINPANGCSATSDSLIASEINQLTAINNQLSVYPNPTTGEVFITVSSSMQDLNDWKLEIADVLGRVFFTESSLGYTNEIEIPNADGLYFMTITNKNGRTVFPIVKQN